MIDPLIPALSPPAVAVSQRLSVRGARERNLRGIDVELPLGQLVVITGVSGSGKSSLAVRTLAAAGQRRVLDSLSSTLSRRVDRLDPPDVDFISHVPPPVLVRWEHAQKSGDARTTVATLLDVERGFAELFTQSGQIVCPKCGTRVQGETPESIYDRLHAGADGRRVMIAFPLGAEHKRRGPAALVQQGCMRAVVGNAMIDLTKLLPVTRISGGLAVVDRLVVGQGTKQRWTESLEVAFREGCGRAAIFREVVSEEPVNATEIDGRPWNFNEFSRDPRCIGCGRVFPPVSPDLFDRCSATGQCHDCRGTGRIAFGVPCDTCRGTRFRWESLAVQIQGASLADVYRRVPSAAAVWLRALPSIGRAQALVASLIDRIVSLEEIGLGHLTLDRSLSTLSAGEVRRTLLAAVVSMDLAETLLVVEEPAAGLHPANVPAVVRALRRPLAQHQSVIVVEHDAAVVAAADHVVELGPEAGERGGQLIAQGSPAAVHSQDTTVTARAWSQCRRAAEFPPSRQINDWIELNGVTGRTLQNITLRIPIGGLTLVTGVSGSGKSSLVMEALPAALQMIAGSSPSVHGEFRWESVGVPYALPCIEIPASPLTTSSRSTVVTWLKAFDDIRQVFAETADARRRGWTASHFSYFSPQGLRCGTCQGRGFQAIDLDVLPDVQMTCPECGGTRYRREIEDARYRGLSIVDVLALTVAEAALVFRSRPHLHQRFAALVQLGLDYLVLGQPASDLSGGEAQRIRLASRLWTKSSQPNVFVCDEPSAGIHPVDVARLANCCRQLVDLGQTLVLIDHQRGLLEIADWIIELGPGAGSDGGNIVVSGRPEELFRDHVSHAGKILRGEIFR